VLGNVVAVSDHQKLVIVIFFLVLLPCILSLVVHKFRNDCLLPVSIHVYQLGVRFKG